MSAVTSPGDPVRVLLVDDQAMVRTGFRMILESDERFVVVGEAANGADVAREAERCRPDVVLMDIQMPGVDGIEATRRIAASALCRNVKVLVLTTFERDDYVHDALRAGASGFLLKNAPPEDLLRAVEVVAAGDALLAPSITRRLIGEVVAAAPRRDLLARLGQLTEREAEVLQHLASGLSNAEMAERLYLGEATVKTHVSRVFAKLELRDRVEAVIFAYESGLVRPGS